MRAKLLFLGILFTIYYSHAQVPANNDCVDAEVITVTTTGTTLVSFNNEMATQSLLSSCDTSPTSYLDVWYEFTMPVTGNIRITAVNFADGFSLYNTCGGAEIDCFYDDGFFYNLTAGTYKLRAVSTASQAGADSFQIQAFEAAANDECANAEVITDDITTATTINFNNAQATESLQSSCDTSPTQDYLDLWYEFTMPVTGNLRITGVNFADGFTLYDNCGTVPTEIDCFYNNNFTYNLAAGTYTLRVVSTAGNANADSFVIQALGTATNDECANAEVISDDITTATTINFNNATATESLQSSCDTSLTEDYLDLWYEFTMPVNGNLSFTGINFADGFTLYDNCGTVPTEIDCFYNNNFIFGLTTGTYTLRVVSTSSNANADSFTMQAFETAANDECANAEVITADITTATTINFNNATATESLQSSCDTSLTEDYLDVWFEFTMPVTGNLSFSGVNFADGFTLYDNCGTVPTEIDCFYNNHFIYNVAAGTYTLRVVSTSGFAGADSFVIQAFQTAANDECANAEIITADITTPTTINFNNASATESLQSSCETSPTDEYLDLWYEFTMPVNGNITITGVNFADGFTLYDTCGTVPTEIECFYNEKIIFGLTTGTYTLRVVSSSIYAGADSFVITAYESITNVDCASAELIQVAAIGECSTQNVTTELRGSTLASSVGSCQNGTQTWLDSWYTFEATLTGNITLNTSSTFNNFTVYDACGGTEVACFNNDGSIPVVFGNTYYLQVSRLETSLTAVTFCLEGAPVVATGTAGVCENIPTVEISTLQGNTNEWVPILDASNNIVAAMNANGNDLGTITTTLFIDNADTRDFSGQPYLRREVSISAQNAPSSNVNVRLYVLGDEVDDLILVDSNLITISDLEVMKVNGNTCTSGYVSGGDFINTVATSYQDDYYIRFNTNSFSVFYPTSTNLDGTLSITGNDEAAFGITIAPTLTDGIVYINAATKLDNVAVNVFDITGRNIYKATFDSIDQTKQTIDLRGYQAGMYFLKISQKNKQFTKRIILK
ncbi:T9SS type A sorting domain-containing protein [Kordia sp. YSTF-M3]|uniref:T9SS type A sorting domain-containing protein n=1 Tax=Kordia aestuariivivens TaxID=2759037 RepID=A0ABR7QDJ2_9FLAO|nr:T9SS type A sorting domain-containing protein [Kordia aestuariivivens]MBC8756605.1 T9SS type A sorting domain-containing protein [Kordia aestuariivivens]